jgi:DNA-binding NtrC family response regulator
MKVLLVDDEESVLEIIGMKIRTWGYDLVTASNGKKALVLIKTKRPDIVVLDYMMPGLDGIDTLKEIRKFDKKMPAVIFTAYPDQRSIAGTQKLGVSAYVPKLSVYSNATDTLKAVLEMTEKRIKR